MPQFKAVLRGKGVKLCSSEGGATFKPAPRASSPAVAVAPVAAAPAPAPAQQQKQQQPPAEAQKGKKQENNKQNNKKTQQPAPAAAPAAPATGAVVVDASPENLALLQAAKDKVRELKTAKADVTEALAEMKRLKALCGEVDPPKKKKK